MLKTAKVTDRIQISHFSSVAGYDEFYIAVHTGPNIPFHQAWAELTDNYGAALSECGLGDDTAAFSRIFLSDFANQKALVKESPLFARLGCGALSVIEQKPVDGGPVSLLSYHLKKKDGAIEKRIDRSAADGWSNSARIAGDNYSLLLTANYLSGQPGTPYEQTKRIFDALSSDLKNGDLTLSSNLIRTWIFLRDIDCHYGGMVKARREFFETHGLTDRRRFPASTGIQGKACNQDEFIAVDALSMSGLKEEQVVKIEAPTHLSSAFSYGVTFERGLEVRFGDRSHLYISGTASINNKGEVLNIGDTEGQVRRTIENIGALLASRNAGLGDLANIIAYVRNFHDREIAAAVLAEKLDGRIPLVFVEAPVCRPTWLFEAECVAILPAASAFPPFL